ncbi:unnamed protein product [Notodromas monacha]|uniref:Uncharacterized protein n=1 Tax=Notodromas monacha TaxID=399045 RepID=A0A7R9BWS0_9CRUS|nr:unnamed protein product [Notodromas monacha]CAG0922030.1 unnamed protein product [Notodromas monacha]
MRPMVRILVRPGFSYWCRLPAASVQVLLVVVVVVVECIPNRNAVNLAHNHFDESPSSSSSLIIGHGQSQFMQPTVRSRVHFAKQATATTGRFLHATISPSSEASITAALLTLAEQPRTQTTNAPTASTASHAGEQHNVDHASLRKQRLIRARAHLKSFRSKAGVRKLSPNSLRTASPDEANAVIMSQRLLARYKRGILHDLRTLFKDGNELQPLQYINNGSILNEDNRPAVASEGLLKVLGDELLKQRDPEGNYNLMTHEPLELDSNDAEAKEEDSGSNMKRSVENSNGQFFPALVLMMPMLNNSTETCMTTQSANIEPSELRDPVRDVSSKSITKRQPEHPSRLFMPVDNRPLMDFIEPLSETVHYQQPQSDRTSCRSDYCKDLMNTLLEKQRAEMLLLSKKFQRSKERLLERQAKERHLILSSIDKDCWEEPVKQQFIVNSSTTEAPPTTFVTPPTQPLATALLAFPFLNATGSGHPHAIPMLANLAWTSQQVSPLTFTQAINTTTISSAVVPKKKKKKRSGSGKKAMEEKRTKREISIGTEREPQALRTALDASHRNYSSSAIAKMARVKLQHSPGQRFGRSGEEMQDDWAPSAGFDAPFPPQTLGNYNDGDPNDMMSSDPCGVPYAMGMDKDTYQRMILMPFTYLGLVFTLLLCSMYTRFKRGKPVSPWSCCPYSAVGGSAGQLTGSGAAGTIGPDGTIVGSGQGQGSEYASVRQGGTIIGVTAGPGGMGGVGGAPGPGGSYGSVGGGGSVAGAPMGGGSVAGAPGSVAAGGGPAGAPPGSTATAPKEKTPLPYERIPTPGVSPYLWSPPATVFQPSPTPAGSFAGSPTGGADADGDESDGVANEDGYMRGKH